MCRRVRQYSILYGHAREISHLLAQAREMLVVVVESQERRRRFNMENVLYDRGRLYLFLEKKRSPRLDVGDKLIVIDQEDRMEMGFFQVHESRTRDYIMIGPKN